MGNKIYLSSLHMSGEGYEMEYIQQAHVTNWIAPLGKSADELENEMAAKVGSQSAIISPSIYQDAILVFIDSGYENLI